MQRPDQMMSEIYYLHLFIIRDGVKFLLKGFQALCFLSEKEGSVEALAGLVPCPSPVLPRTKGLQEMHGLSLTQADTCPKGLPGPAQGDDFGCCLSHLHL